MNRKKRAKLHELYNLLPKVKCKGLCVTECTTLGMYRSEFVQLTRISGKEPKLDLTTERCNYLTPEGRCSVYEDRPWVCRAWGVVPSMECYYGCVPERLTTDAEEKALLRAIGAFLGEHEFMFTATPEELAAIFLKEGLNSSEAEFLGKAMTGGFEKRSPILLPGGFD